MIIRQAFTIDRPRDHVWSLFQDIPQLAECMPGASLDEVRDDGVYSGQVSIKIGPFKAAFQGEVKHVPDSQSFSGHAYGKGIDKRGGSRSSMAMDYALMEEGGATEVTVDAEIQLSGPIAQFGRTGVVEQTAKLLISQFASNIERRLSGEVGDDQAKDSNSIKVLPLLGSALTSRLKGKSKQT